MGSPLSLTALKHALPDMARWDDLPDDVQEIVSACVRRNLEACLAEEAIRLLSFVKETWSNLDKFRTLGPRSVHTWAEKWQKQRRLPDAELPRLEAEFRAWDEERMRPHEERIFAGVPWRNVRKEALKTVDAYVDRCTAYGAGSPEFERLLRWRARPGMRV